MKTRISVSLAVVVVVIPLVLRAQTSFQNLTPGASTRADVEQALGRATSARGNIAEYRAPEGLQKVAVRYGPGNVVEGIEVYLLQPVTRRALVERFGLPAGDGIRKKTADGKLIEFFGEPAYLSFTYATADVAAGVSSLGHFSAPWFAEACCMSGIKRAN